MKSYAVEARDRRDLRAPSFEESLYDHLRAAPWWLASAGIHLVLVLVLSVLFGSDATAPARASEMAVSMDAPPRDWEREPVPPMVTDTPPIDQPDEVRDEVPFDPVVTEDPPPEPDSDPEESHLDDRFTTRGPFAGDSPHGEIGLGPGGGGGSFSGRGPGNLKASGRGGVLTATDAGLEWLRRHQSPHGAWDCDGFESRCTGSRCGGPGGAAHDPGVTGLALLAFLGYGETHRSPRHGAVVRGGLKYLKSVQDAEGCFGPRTGQHFVYDHAIAALAMAEAYGMTGSPLFKSSAQTGVDFIDRCRNPYLAWRYGIKPQENDTSVTGWMVMALKSAKLAGLSVDPDAFDGAIRWLDKVTEPEYGRAGYTARGNGPARPQELLDRFPSDRSESLTAVAVLTRIFCGAAPDDPMVRKGTELCVKSLPAWDEAAGTVDHYYWYYGSLAMFQVGGEPWKRWRAAMETAILAHQHGEGAGDRRGSWDPVDPWGADGGRVYSTAINVLNLEVYYRYPNVFGAK